MQCVAVVAVCCMVYTENAGRKEKVRETEADSMLQCVAVCAVCCSVIQRIAMCVAVCCSVLQCVARHEKKAIET